MPLQCLNTFLPNQRSSQRRYSVPDLGEQFFAVFSVRCYEGARVPHRSTSMSEIACFMDVLCPAMPVHVARFRTKPPRICKQSEGGELGDPLMPVLHLLRQHAALNMQQALVNLTRADPVAAKLAAATSERPSYSRSTQQTPKQILPMPPEHARENMAPRQRKHYKTGTGPRHKNSWHRGHSNLPRTTRGADPSFPYRITYPSGPSGFYPILLLRRLWHFPCLNAPAGAVDLLTTSATTRGAPESPCTCNAFKNTSSEPNAMTTGKLSWSPFIPCRIGHRPMVSIYRPFTILHFLVGIDNYADVENHDYCVNNAGTTHACVSYPWYGQVHVAGHLWPHKNTNVIAMVACPVTKMRVLCACDSRWQGISRSVAFASRCEDSCHSINILEISMSMSMPGRHVAGRRWWTQKDCIYIFVFTNHFTLGHTKKGRRSQRVPTMLLCPAGIPATVIGNDRKVTESCDPMIRHMPWLTYLARFDGWVPIKYPPGFGNSSGPR